MIKLSNRNGWWGIGCILLMVTALHGEEITGHVATVTESVFTIQSTSPLLPRPGDQLEVYINLPEIGRARVAKGVIISASDDQIEARIQSASGAVRTGQMVSINSPNPTKRTAPADELSNWGTSVDPDNDCEFLARNGKLTITIPSGLHDLWPGRPVPSQSFNAPRVLKEVTGDFTLQVKVSADWKPYPPDVNYGAGLLIWQSPKHLLRRERHAFMYRGQPTCFSKPLYLQEGKRVDDKQLTSAEYYRGTSTWLRIKRRGQEINSAISHDGKSWVDTGTLATTFDRKVQVGVHVFKVSPGTFTATFEDFQLVQD